MKKTLYFILGIIVLIIIAVFFIAGKNQNQAVSQPSQGVMIPIYSNPDYGFSVQYPNTFTATTTFSISYLLPDSWNVDAPEGTGEQVIDLQYPGSNNILSAEVRIGVSKDADQVASCTTVPQNQGLTSGTSTINGETFTTFSGSDAAMSHFASIKRYRIVKNQTCYAIDEVIYGVNPEVYSPPAVVPFVQALAQTALDGIVKTFTFTNQ